MIGEKICKSRKSAKLSGTELGDAVGLTGAAISNIETGKLKGGPSPDLVVRIAEALNDDSILLHYIETNPVYQHILPKVFPDLNNIRRDPTIIFTRLANVAQDVHEAARIMARIFANVEPDSTPIFDATFKAKMEQIIDIKRAVDLLEFELLSSGVINKTWLDDIYGLQQRKQNKHQQPKLVTGTDW